MSSIVLQKAALLYKPSIKPPFRYNQIKNYDFQKNEFKGSASDFTQMVWKETGVVGFGSKTAADGFFICIGLLQSLEETTRRLDSVIMLTELLELGIWTNPNVSLAFAEFPECNWRCEIAIVRY